jgi:DNA-binding transcriptional LysR family regulator
VLDLRLVNCFLEVANARSFSAAAVRLGIAQSATSTSIRRLEDVLGIRLLSRTSRKVELTPAGTAFLPHAEALMAAEARTRSAAFQISQHDIRCLRIGSYQFLAKARSKLVSRYISRFPDDQIVIHYGTRAELLEELRRGNLDMVIGLTASGDTEKDVGIHPLGPLIGHLVVAPQGDLHVAEEVSLAMLEGQNMAIVPSTVDPKVLGRIGQLFLANGVRLVVTEETEKDASDAYARARGLMHLRWLARRKARHLSDGWAIIPFSDESVAIQVAAMGTTGGTSAIQRFLDALS